VFITPITACHATIHLASEDPPTWSARTHSTTKVVLKYLSAIFWSLYSWTSYSCGRRLSDMNITISYQHNHLQTLSRGSARSTGPCYTASMVESQSVFPRDLCGRAFVRRVYSGQRDGQSSGVWQKFDLKEAREYYRTCKEGQLLDEQNNHVFEYNLVSCTLRKQ